MPNPTSAQLTALIELADRPRGSHLEGVRPATLRAMENRGWAYSIDSECTWHITQAGFDTLSRNRWGMEYLDILWSAAHLGYAHSREPLTPRLLSAAIDQYDTMMDSAARLDDAAHWRTCDALRAQAVFVLARIAAAVDQQLWQHPHHIIRKAAVLVSQTHPEVADVDPVDEGGETAVCVHDERPIGRRRVGRGAWFHIDARGGLRCFADPTREHMATPRPLPTVVGGTAAQASEALLAG